MLGMLQEASDSGESSTDSSGSSNDDDNAHDGDVENNQAGVSVQEAPLPLSLLGFEGTGFWDCNSQKVPPWGIVGCKPLHITRDTPPWYLPPLLIVGWSFTLIPALSVGQHSVHRRAQVLCWERT